MAKAHHRLVPVTLRLQRLHDRGQLTLPLGAALAGAGPAPMTNEWVPQLSPGGAGPGGLGLVGARRLGRNTLKRLTRLRLLAMG